MYYLAAISVQVGGTGDSCRVFVSIYNTHKHMTETNTGRKFKHCIYLPQGVFSPFLSAPLNMVQHTEKGSGTSSSTSGHADKMLHREKSWTGMQKPVISDTQRFQILKHNNKTYLFF